MALSIKISSFVSAGYTNPVSWRLFKAGTNILVDTHLEPGPHGQEYNFSFVDNIEDIVYTVAFYEETGGDGTLIKSHDITVTTSTLVLDADLELIVGGGESYDPVADTDSVIIPQCKGKDYYIMQRAVGQLLEVRIAEITKNLLDGGFQLNNGYKFNEGDVYIIKFRATIVVNPPNSQTPSIYKEVVFIDNNTVITGADFGKLLIVDSMNPVVTITFPLIADIIEDVPLFIESVGSVHNNVVMKAQGGENITGLGTAKNTFILGKGERSQFIRKGLKLYGFTDSLDIKKAGSIEFGNYVPANRLFGNGAEYTIANYPRIKEAFTLMNTTTYALFDSIQVIDGAAVKPYSGFFAISNDNTKFKVPDLRDRMLKFLKYLDNTVDPDRVTQKSGGYGHDRNKLHDHFMFGQPDNGGAPYAATGHSTGGNLGYGIWGSNGTPLFFKSGPSGGTTVNPITIGQIPLIIF